MNILLVPADIFWAEGKIALNIFKQSLKIRSNRFIIFPAHQIKYRKKEFEELLKKVDAVHWLMNASNVPFLANRDLDELGVYSIATLHHAEKDEDYKIEKIKKANLIHVVSSEWQDYLVKLGLTAHLAPLGVNATKYISKQKKIKGTKIIIGHFGNIPNLTNRKRIDVLINGLELCKENGLQVELRLAGRISKETVQLLDEKKIDYINLGYLTEKKLIKAYSELDAYIITSDCEGGPFGVLEAMACSTPVISTKVGLALDVIIDKVNGFLINKNDPEALYNAITKICEISDIRQTQNQIRHSILSYDWSVVYKSYYEIYTQVPSNKKMNIASFIYANLKTFLFAYYLKYKNSLTHKYFKLYKGKGSLMLHQNKN